MAKSPQKSKDPTEEALSAIQEALSIHQPVPRREVALAPAADVDSGHGQNHGLAPIPPVTADLFHEETQSVHEETPSPGWAADDSSPRRAANDDRANIGQILQTLRRRPARVPYIVASIAAFVWAASGLATAFLYSAELQAAFATPRIGFAAMIALVGAIVAPAIFFYVIALMFARSQDMRVVAETMAEIAMRLAQPETSARESIVSVGQAVRREVAAMGDGVERAIARAAELESLMHNEVSALERAYSDNEVRIRDLLGELTNQRETMVGQAEQVRNAIASVHLDLAHDIASVGDLVADKVNDVAQRVTRTLAEKGEHITMALGHAGDSMIDALTERGSTLLDRLETTSDSATTAIASASDRLSASLTLKTEHVHDEYAELAARLQQMMTSRLDSVAQGFAQRAAQTVEKMAGSSQAFTDAIADTGAQMADTVAARAGEVNTTLRATGDQLTDMLAVRLRAFEDMFNHGGTELSEKIARDAGTLGNLITRHIAEFDRTVKTYGGELVERLGARTQDVSEALRSYVDTFDQRVGSRTSELTGTLDQRLLQFEQALGARVSGLAQALNEGGKDVVGALDQRIAEAASTINARGAEVADAIGAKTAEIDRTLGARALEVADTLDSRIGRFEELLIGRAENVTQQIETRTKAAADTLNASMEQFSHTITTDAAEAERTLGALARSTSEAIRTSASEAERTLVGLSDEIANKVSRHTNEMATVLSEKTGGVLSALAAKGEQFSGEVTKATDQAITSIEQKGFAFTRAMLDNSGEISRMINSAGETASNSVTRTLNDLSDVAQKAIAQSRETATATVSEMLETHNMLRSDTTTLFERLREANIMLQEVLSGSHENMSALENTLMLRVAEFVTAMNEVTGSTGEVTDRVERNITNFRDITSHVVADLGQLAGQFDAHGRELAKAAELIERSNQRTEDIVGERRVQLDSLVATLDIRTEDIEQRLKRFSGLLDESLEAASTRAREVARVVSESSAEGSRAITEQYDRVRENAEDERRRAGDAMRSIYEQTAGDTHALFRDANERFAETVQGMKQMAAEMQRELEATRTELRRGVFELPQETAESAAQMRRVIVDQIEALAELNRIVARHGRNLDAVEPVRRQREEPTLAIVGGRNDLPPRIEAPSRPAPRNDVGSFAPAARRAEAPSLSPAQAVAGRGWLSDLLTRASREEGAPARELPRESAREPNRENLREPPRAPEERPPRHSIESLDSLSVDIARMIDHDAAADLWDRYKRGERNVFTRRLYTLQGQQAFDEIRKKYRADREFKQTVDRYIGEFERLLEEVARDDRGQVVARTYLTSETGKVYTMLAHAAGRFD